MMFDQQSQEDMQRVVDYLYADESKDFEVRNQPDNHIFHAVRRLQIALDHQEAPFPNHV
jgi:hypothetical protein